KCLGKMQDVSRQEGRTVLFVSHNMMAVQGLCHRVLWLNGGAIVKDGSTKQVIADYLSNEISTERERVWHDPRSAPGNEKVRIHRAYIRPETTDSAGRITLETPVRVGFEFWNLVANARLSLSVVLYNQEGIIILNTVGIREAKW